MLGYMHIEKGITHGHSTEHCPISIRYRYDGGMMIWVLLAVVVALLVMLKE